MDQSNLNDLRRLARGPEDRAKLSLLRAYDPQSPPGAEVPDPWFGGRDGFARVFDIVQAACGPLLETLERAHKT